MDRGKETERVWSREYSKRIPRDIQERALMKLQQLNAAGDLKDLSIPSSNQLEALKGDRKGEYSIRVNKALLDRLGIVLPKRMRLADSELAALAIGA